MRDDIIVNEEGGDEEQKQTVSVCGLDHKTIRKAIKIRQFY